MLAETTARRTVHPWHRTRQTKSPRLWGYVFAERCRFIRAISLKAGVW